MASSQSISTIHVAPKDFIFCWGLFSEHWRLPTDSDSSVELKSVWVLRFVGRIPINPLKKNSVNIAFDLLKTSSSSGWDKSNVTIGVKVGESSITEDGQFYCKDVNAQIKDAKVAQNFLVSENFVLEPNNSASDSYLYFGLFDKPLNEKRRLIIYDSIVEVVEADL